MRIRWQSASGKERNEEGEEERILRRESGEGECAGAGRHAFAGARVLPDPKQKATDSPKHKETLAELLSRTEE